MSGINLDIVGQRQKLLVNAAVQQCRVLTRASGQVGTADRADKQRVARQQEPRIGAAPEVRAEQADALR
jgi:hypothetical protein